MAGGQLPEDPALLLQGDLDDDLDWDDLDREERRPGGA